MSSKNIEWAICTVEEQLNALEDRRDEFCDRADISTTVVQKLHDTIAVLNDRYADLLYSAEKELEIDVQPEFAFLCHEIQFLRERRLKLLCAPLMANGSLTVITHSITSVVRCIAGIEMAVVTMLSAVCTGILIKDQATRSIVRYQQSTSLQLEVKLERLQSILQKSDDIRFACIAIEIFGLRTFQEMRNEEFV